MILFKQEHVIPVQRKKKTQTRRTGKKRWNLGSIHQAKLNFKKGAKPFAYLRIVGVHEEFLGQITEEDARKEGYPNVRAYKKKFREIYGFWKAHEPVWVIDFELANEEEYLAEKKAS